VFIPRHLKKTPIAVVMPFLLGYAASQPSLAQLMPPPAPIKTYAGDPGQIGDPASWRTAQFLRDWGMRAVSAEFAYAAGFAGLGMNVGVVDSGFLQSHVVEFPSDRVFSVTNQGGTTGPTPAYYNQAFNNSHGTHVSGTVGASRDASTATPNMHGVAFNADLYEVNTHKTDGVFYGDQPANVTDAGKLDNEYIGNAYRAINSALTANGKPVRIITSSWGSQPNTENYNTYDPPPNATPAQAGFGVNTAWRYLYVPEGVPDTDGNTSHWINGAIEVARTGTILQFTAGNGGYQYTTPRASATYFLPELEGRWYTTSGINTTNQVFNADGSILVPGSQLYNRCGLAKWACVTAPGQSINSTTVAIQGGVPVASYGSSSGTSMAGPHSAAILATIMQRFPYMTNEQALYTMMTTARQNATINDPSASPGTNTFIPNPTRGQLVQVPDIRNGWGTVNLRDAIKGPAQLLGPFSVDTNGYSDVWSNDISDVAIHARQLEDAAEAATWEATKIAKGWTTGVPPDASDADKSDYAIGTRREAARNARIYVGSLTKQGDGTLFLTGNVTYGDTANVNGGKLSIVGTHASDVVVNGGTLGGSGTIAGGINVVTGLLQPGLFPEEASSITDVSVLPGNVLTAGAPVHIGHKGGYAATIRGDTDYTQVVTSSNLILDGALLLSVSSSPAPGTVQTIMRGRKVVGTFAGLPEGSILTAGASKFRISYRNNQVTLTALAV
jgi:autotransporter-associated beta strand protein